MIIYNYLTYADYFTYFVYEKKVSRAQGHAKSKLPNAGSWWPERRLIPKTSRIIANDKIIHRLSLCRPELLVGIKL